MKYSRLPDTELQKLEKEFIHFLAVNSITADDWKKLQEESSSKIDDLINDFSDMVYHRVMQKIEYLDHRTKNEVKTFKAQKDKIILLSLVINSPEVDLTNESELQSILKGNKTTSLEVYRTEKEYTKEREVELFEMMQNGCCIVDASLYEFLSQLHEKV